MSLPRLTSDSLNHLLALVQKRETLEAEISRIESQITASLGGQAAPSAPATGKRRGPKPKAAAAAAPSAAPKTKAKGKIKRGKRGALKNSVLGALKAAGKSGISVKDLSAKLGVKNQNLHVWFHTTGKTIGGLKKVGTGKWALTA